MANRFDKQEEIAAIAGAMLAGSTSFIEGARMIVHLSHRSGLDSDPDILRLIGIDSATDALPIDAATRKLWSTEALERLQSEIERSEQWARDIGTDYCRALVARFSKRSQWTSAETELVLVPTDGSEVLWLARTNSMTARTPSIATKSSRAS
jgi:hypothetical protein